MKKTWLVLILMALLSSCNTPNNSLNLSSSQISDNIGVSNENYLNKTLCLTINTQDVSVDWLDNDSTKELKRLAQEGLVITLHQYGGFEQVGQIGTTLPANDIKITTNPGDIVLYLSNQIVIFYGSNTWEYTKLGHINLKQEELENLLASNENVTITFTLK